MFDDPMDGGHLFLGYVIGKIPEDYNDYIISTSINEYDEMKRKVDTVLQEIYPSKEMFYTQYITFTEYR